MLTAGKLPVVMCIDQLDFLLGDKVSAPLLFSTAVMGLRSEIPNLLIVLSCLKDAWLQLADNFLAAFRDRTVRPTISTCSASKKQRSFVRLRLAHWEGAPDARSEWWPLHEASFRAWIASTMLLRPRGLLKDCEERYEEWADAGNLDQPLAFGAISPADPLAGLST